MEIWFRQRSTHLIKPFALPLTLYLATASAMTDSLTQFLVEIDRADRDINLAKAGLYVAQIEYPDLDLDRYLGILEIMAAEVSQRLPKTRYPLKVIQTDRKSVV